MNLHLKNIYEGILDGDSALVKNEVQAALDAGIMPEKILNDGMIAAMAEVGQLFEIGECFVPEMLISARAMKQGLSVLRPELKKADVKPVGKVVIGTVQGDLHDIGKNLVGMMLEGHGFEIVDLGVDVAPEKFVASAASEGARVVAVSSLLTTTMSGMSRVVDAFTDADARKDVVILVGGAPVTKEFADQIGADGYADDASQAVAVTKALLNL